MFRFFSSCICEWRYVYISIISVTIKVWIFGGGELRTIKIIISLLLWIVLDLILGRRSQRKHNRTLAFEQTRGNYRFYKNGTPLFEDLFEEISQAQEQIDVYYYLVRRDIISRKFMTLLKMKAEEGVRVNLLVDRLVSAPLRREYRSLKKAGVDVAFAETPKFPFFFYTFNRRNHRKMVVIDGVIGYVGGFNVGREYIGKSSQFIDWRDYHLRLTGSIVRDLHRIIASDWTYNTGGALPSVAYREGGKHPFQLVAFDGIGVENTFLTMIRRARREILIGSPYFIPTKRIHRELLKALERGVDVHILLPLKRDHAFVKEAGFPSLQKLVLSGANVYHYNAGFYHAKLVLVDEEAADIGTANFDKRSMFLNKEVTISIFEESFVRHLRSEYFKDTENSLVYGKEQAANPSVATKVKTQLVKPFRWML